jgi:hypothetical protein
LGPTEEVFPSEAEVLGDSQENAANVWNDVTIGAHPELVGLRELILEFVDSFRDRVDSKVTSIQN